MFQACLRPDAYTDVDQANAFVRAYGEHIRYCDGISWLNYDGGRWNENAGLRVQKLVQDFTEAQMEEARSEINNAQTQILTMLERSGGHDTPEIKMLKEDSEEAEKYHKHAIKYRSSSAIKATMKEAMPSLEIKVEDLDSQADCINTPGGTIDLCTGEMKSHDPEDYITKMTNVSPGTEGIEIWEEFLSKVTCGNEELQNYLQLVCGMALYGKVEQEKLIIVYGGGGNGKSSFWNAIAKVMGDYAGNMTPDALMAGNRRNMMPEYANLRGKRLVIAAQLNEGQRLDAGAVKRLCSTDTIHAEPKYRNPFDFVPSHTIVLYTNHLPKVGSSDKGTWDRLVVVPFNASFRGEEGEITNYADYLFKNCGGAILGWMVQGAKTYIANRFMIPEPKVVSEALEEYQSANDWLSAFLDECADKNKQAKTLASIVYQKYRSHAESTGEYIRSSVDFRAEMEKRGYEYRRTNKGNMVNVALRDTPCRSITPFEDTLRA